jgi:hypothetical protein
MEGITLFSVYNAGDKGTLFMVLGGAAIAAVMGILALKTGMQRWQAVVAIVGFAMFFVKFRAQIGDIFGGPLAGKLMVIGTLVGLVSAIVAVAKPAPAR